MTDLSRSICNFFIPCVREVRTLTLTISEAHRLPLKLVPNPYVVVSYNNVKVLSM